MSRKFLPLLSFLLAITTAVACSVTSDGPVAPSGFVSKKDWAKTGADRYIWDINAQTWWYNNPTQPVQGVGGNPWYGLLILSTAYDATCYIVPYKWNGSSFVAMDTLWSNAANNFRKNWQFGPLYADEDIQGLWVCQGPAPDLNENYDYVVASLDVYPAGTN